MSLTLVFRGPEARGECWKEIVCNAIDDITWYTWPDVSEPEKVDALITWLAPKGYEQLFPNLKAIFSVGAGVDQFAPASLPAHLKLVRMVDPNINLMMTTYVLSSVLMLHRDQFHYARMQQEKQWSPKEVALPHECNVGILGLGQLGQSVATQLQQLGFNVSGWNRSEKVIPGVSVYAGSTALPDFLSTLDILICLLPLTDETRGILNASLFSALPEGAALINVGRGQHLVEEDLLAALDSGQLSQAVLDVFEKEPLSAEHPYWSHPKIHITPHIASSTRNDTAGHILAQNLKRWLAGDKMTGEVDKMKGY